MSNEQYLDRLYLNAGVTSSPVERDSLTARLNSGAETRGSVLRKVAENESLSRQELNRAFVLMQYFGYLRRNADDLPDENMDGYNFWLAKLDQFGGDFRRAEMVKSFLVATEYRSRFGRP